jgi:hypothetical protein
MSRTTCGRIPRILRRGVFLRRFDDVDQVMGNAAPFCVDSLSVPMSKPRYTAVESQLMISPRQRSATVKDSVLLPVAVAAEDGDQDWVRGSGFGFGVVGSGLTVSGPTSADAQHQHHDERDQNQQQPELLRA